jgi:hypothetical protein
MLSIEALLTAGCAVNTFVCKDFKQRIPLYAINFIALFLLALLVGNTYMCVVYILILTEFYISSPNLKTSLTMGAASLLTFEFVYGFIMSNASDLWGIIAACFNESMILIVHFLLVNFALSVYDSRQQLKESLTELDESNRKLQQAYNELADTRHGGTFHYDGHHADRSGETDRGREPARGKAEDRSGEFTGEKRFGRVKGERTHFGGQHLARHVERGSGRDHSRLLRRDGHRYPL